MAKLDLSEKSEEALSAGCRKADEDTDMEMHEPVIRKLKEVNDELSKIIGISAPFNANLCELDPPQGEEISKLHKQLLDTFKRKIFVLDGIWAGWKEKIRGSTFKDAKGPFRALPFYPHV